MNTKTKPQQTGSKKDVLIWILVFVLVIAALAANYYFRDVVWTLRVVGWIVLAGIVVFLVMLTRKGVQIWKFGKESRTEMRKVVWPKRQETIRTTAIVIALVLLTALIMWGADAILFWLIGLLTG